MAGKFFHYRRGYLHVCMTGCAPERFFNICSGRDIEIWDVVCHKNKYEFYMTIEGFKNAKSLVRKAGVRLKIMKKLGLPFFLYRNRKRKLSFAGFLLFFFMLYTMSLFIWDIEIYGNTRYSRDTLMNFLESQNISYGIMAKNIHCEAIEEALRMEFSEITWVSAQVSGTRLLVKIKENEVLSAIPEKDTNPCDIVAEKPGVITSMIVRSGTPVVKPGDTVEKGQVLVSGILTVTDDSESLVAEHPVHADAVIWGKTSSSFKSSFPTWKTVESYTGKRKNGLFLKAFHYSFTLLPPTINIPGINKAGLNEKRPWKFTMEEKQGHLFDNFYLPFYWGKITGKEYEIYERPYTQEEKEELKEAVNSLFLEKLNEKGVQIMGNNVRIQESGGKITVICTAETEENIGISRPLSTTGLQE